MCGLIYFTMGKIDKKPGDLPLHRTLNTFPIEYLVMVLLLVYRFICVGFVGLSVLIHHVSGPTEKETLSWIDL